MSHSDLIIGAFLDDPKRTLSGEALARRLGVSRTSVWKHIKALQEEGYRIEVLKGRGYRLKGLSARPIEREVKRGLLTERFGQRVFYYEKIGSTNDVVKELARRGEKEGTLVIAEEQLNGRGRLDRSWESPRGGVFMSLIMRPNLHPTELTRLILLSGVAVARAIKSLYGLDGRLKWPNDIFYEDKKLGGILSEMEGEAERVNFVVVGIGIDANCNVSVDIPTTSLKKETGREINIIKLVQEILKEVESLYEAFMKGSLAFLEEYKELSHTLGRDVKIVRLKDTIVGRAVDIDSNGALVLRLPDGSYEKV
ncbi:MAG: biotin--[acetyl-CoA-carboxylase] ligase, partial [Candidatus Hydrothermarchaeales archaeon]